MSEKTWSIINNDVTTIISSYEDIRYHYDDILLKINDFDYKNKMILPQKFLTDELVNNPFFHIMFKVYNPTRIDIRKYFDTILGKFVIESILEQSLSFDKFVDLLLSKGYNPLNTDNENDVKKFINNIKYDIKDELKRLKLIDFVKEKTNELQSLKENSVIIIFMPNLDFKFVNENEIEQYNIQSLKDFDNLLKNLIFNKKIIDEWNTLTNEEKTKVFNEFINKFSKTSHINSSIDVKNGLHIYSPMLNSNNSKLLKDSILIIFDKVIGGSKRYFSVDNPADYNRFGWSLD